MTYLKTDILLSCKCFHWICLFINLFFLFQLNMKFVFAKLSLTVTSILSRIFQYSDARTGGTSPWFDWVVLLSILVSTNCKGICSSSPCRYPFWACYQIPCMVGTPHHGAIYFSWSFLYNCLVNARQPPTGSEFPNSIYAYLHKYKSTTYTHTYYHS